AAYPRWHGCGSSSVCRITIMLIVLIDLYQGNSHGPSQTDRGEEAPVLHRGRGEQGPAAGSDDRQRHCPTVPRRGGPPATALDGRERAPASLQRSLLGGTGPESGGAG